MKILIPALTLKTHTVVSTNKKQLIKNIKALRKFGWAWDGLITTVVTAKDKVYAASLASLTAIATSEIVITANPREWLHIFAMRTTKEAHPQMREVMLPLQEEFARRWPALFGV